MTQQQLDDLLAENMLNATSENRPVFVLLPHRPTPIDRIKAAAERQGLVVEIDRALERPSMSSSASFDLWLLTTFIPASP